MPDAPTRAHQPFLDGDLEFEGALPPALLPPAGWQPPVLSPQFPDELLQQTASTGGDALPPPDDEDEHQPPSSVGRVSKKVQRKCRVPGCQAVLSDPQASQLATRDDTSGAAASRYSWRLRVCDLHRKAPLVTWPDGESKRWCQARGLERQEPARCLCFFPVNTNALSPIACPSPPRQKCARFEPVADFRVRARRSLRLGPTCSAFYLLW